jgi:hypothetical protein
MLLRNRHGALVDPHGVVGTTNLINQLSALPILCSDEGSEPQHRHTKTDNKHKLGDHLGITIECPRSGNVSLVGHVASVEGAGRERSIETKETTKGSHRGKMIAPGALYGIFR